MLQSAIKVDASDNEELEAGRTALAEIDTVGMERELTLGGALCIGDFIDVPLDYNDPGGTTIQVFFKEVLLAEHAKRRSELPVLLCLHGGPGFAAPRPGNASDGWFGYALQNYRILLIDQRGTGRSAPFTAQTMRGMSAAEQAAYLTHFRSDSIVEDFEAVRLAVDVDKISLLGDSFGGSLAITYVSRHPDSIVSVFLTGGLPSVQENPDDVYHGMYCRLIAQNRRYYARYPNDIGKVREIVLFLENAGQVALPDGGVLTPHRFLALGTLLGGVWGTETLHQLISDAFVDVGDRRELDYRFLLQVGNATHFDTNPLYWLLQEAMFLGPSTGAANWSAERVMKKVFSKMFDYKAVLAAPASEPVFFTGEMIFPWLLEDFSQLRPFKEAAGLIATKADWPAIYSEQSLRDTRVPVAVAISDEHIYTDFASTHCTANLLGQRCKIWVSEELKHFGLCEAVLDTLFRMTRGESPPRDAISQQTSSGAFSVNPMDQETIEELHQQEAKLLLSPSSNWKSLYWSFRRRVRNGAEEELLQGGAVSRGHYITVPLDYKAPSGGATIQVFFREVMFASEAEKIEKLPALILLVGGPGFPAQRPFSATDGWLGRALHDYRVLLLDQRGTGRSTVVNAQTLKGMSAKRQAEYLAHFRADSIVEDCEAIRQKLNLQKLTVLGESFGGFCALSYLSKHPSSLSAVYLTGGLAPVLASGPDEVYRRTYQRMIARNKRYYARYPGDVAKVREIVAHLQECGGMKLPHGGKLTPRRFLSLGMVLGTAHGLEAVHLLMEDAFVFIDGEVEIDHLFLRHIEEAQTFDTNPLYWILHEAIYCGQSSKASNWSAARVLEEKPFCKEFDFASKLKDPDEPPIFFTGEMVYPWFAEDYATLSTLSEAANLLAAKADWTDLYDPDVLKNTTVPVAAHIDSEDIYVDTAMSQATAKLLGSNCTVWISDEFQHSGLGDDGAAVLDRLMDMACVSPKQLKPLQQLQFEPLKTLPTPPPQAKSPLPAAVRKLVQAGARSKVDASGYNEGTLALTDAPEDVCWVVVGGSEGTGILVRDGPELTTLEMGRLEVGAKVRQLEVQKGRLFYKKIEGKGPDSGWVSLIAKGRTLLERP